ncbi:MAG: hypothetical protein OXI15_17260, partial [Chromatiales bacterium]|nr:hypothetical protein [Chromatiales bacterium]
MFIGNGVDGLLRVLDSTKGHTDPDILQGIRQLAEEPGDVLQSFREKLVHPILDRTRVAHVVYVDFKSDLSNGCRSVIESSRGALVREC